MGSKDNSNDKEQEVNMRCKSSSFFNKIVFGIISILGIVAVVYTVYCIRHFLNNLGELFDDLGTYIGSVADILGLITVILGIKEFYMKYDEKVKNENENNALNRVGQGIQDEARNIIEKILEVAKLENNKGKRELTTKEILGKIMEVAQRYESIEGKKLEKDDNKENYKDIASRVLDFINSMASARLGNKDFELGIGDDRYETDSKLANNKEFVKQRNIFFGRFISELSYREGSKISRDYLSGKTKWKYKVNNEPETKAS